MKFIYKKTDDSHKGRREFSCPLREAIHYVILIENCSNAYRGLLNNNPL